MICPWPLAELTTLHARRRACPSQKDRKQRQVHPPVATPVLSGVPTAPEAVGPWAAAGWAPRTVEAVAIHAFRTWLRETRHGRRALWRRWPLAELTSLACAKRGVQNRWLRRWVHNVNGTSA